MGGREIVICHTVIKVLLRRSRAPLSLCFYYRINYTISLFFRNIISSLCISHSRAPADAPMPKAFLFAFLECVKKEKEKHIWRKWTHGQRRRRKRWKRMFKTNRAPLKKEFRIIQTCARSSKICDRYTAGNVQFTQNIFTRACAYLRWCVFEFVMLSRALSEIVLIWNVNASSHLLFVYEKNSHEKSLTHVGHGHEKARTRAYANSTR